MAYRLKTKRTRKHATLNSLTETAILSLVAKLGQKCHSLQMKKAKIYKNIRKIKYSTTEQKHMELCTKTINLTRKAPGALDPAVPPPRGANTLRSLKICAQVV